MSGQFQEFDTNEVSRRCYIRLGLIMMKLQLPGKLIASDVDVIWLIAAI